MNWMLNSLLVVMAALDESVLDFVSEFTGVGRPRIALTTTLFGDLGIDGDDGHDIMAAFAEKFQVDMSEFRLNRHFGTEGLSVHAPLVFLWWLMSWIFRAKQSPEERAGLEPVRISDLIAAAKSKKWNL